eukprot:TRINITY_DN3203_c0_g1_i5.p2 TRINITY_DN3203_c0_g1~~TRINITY_DN3203_c0_g1_i5.p2  ORF type:complete len:294 (-),score=49.18 TRINITY_DN3203_c0_g1_i5:1153-2034(-)
MIYLDYNATTPLCPEAVTAIKTLLDDPTSFGNPSSNHSFGEAAHRVVETARARVAGLLNCESNEIIFTSGGTESNNLALVGAARANKHRGRHIITTSIEHPAVANVLSALVHEGFAVTTLPVDVYGRLSPKTLQDALAAHPDTILVSVMHSNNEVGTVQPIAELAKLARAGGALFHTDAAQSIGKVPVDVRALGVDLLSLAAHKLYSPKGLSVRLFLESKPANANRSGGAVHSPRSGDRAVYAGCQPRGWAASWHRKCAADCRSRRVVRDAARTVGRCVGTLSADAKSSLESG